MAELTGDGWEEGRNGCIDKIEEREIEREQR